SLEKGILASRVDLSDAEKDSVGMLPLLTIKPQIIVRNVDEGKIGTGDLTICAKLEAELAELSIDEAKDYLKELGIKESGLEKLIRIAYMTLGLISFFTAGEK